MYNLQFLMSSVEGLAKLTLIFLSPNIIPFFLSIASKVSSDLVNLTKPYPKLFFVALSLMTLATDISPCSAKSVYKL